MLRSLMPLIAMAVVAMFATACYSTPEGRLRAGVPFVRDDIVSRYELPLDRVHDAAVQVIEDNGVLTSDDSVKKVVVGTIDGSTVWVGFDDSVPGITTVTVTARTGAGAADVTTASEVDKQIYGVLIRN